MPVLVVYAQDSDQSSSDAGVLVSSPTRQPAFDQDSTKGANSNSPASNVSSQNAKEDNHRDASNDEIIVKSTNAVIFQMVANLKLTQDQIDAVRPIITDTVVKVRELEQKLKGGIIDSKIMYNQRLEVIKEANRKLNPIMTAGQMKVWEDMQAQSEFF